MATYNFVSTAYGWTLAKDGGIAKPYFVKPDRIEPVGGDISNKIFSLVWDNGRTETYDATKDTIQIAGASVSGNTLASIINQLGTDIFFLTNGAGGIDETAARTYANEEITEWAAATPVFTSQVKIQYASASMRFVPTTNFQEMKIMFSLADQTEVAGIKFNLNTGNFDIGGFGGSGLHPRMFSNNNLIADFASDRTLKLYKDGINIHFRPATGASNYLGFEWRDSTDAILGAVKQQVATGAVFIGSHAGDATPEILLTYSSRKTQIGYDLDILGNAKLVGVPNGFDVEVKAMKTFGSTIKGYTLGNNMLPVYGGSSFALVDGTIYWGILFVPEAGTLTGARFWQQTTGAFTEDNNNRIGLYTISAGVLTQVAASANNANLWKNATGVTVSEPFTSTYSASAGYFWVACIYNNSAQTTAPTVGAGLAAGVGGYAGFDLTNNVKFFGTTNGADLPASQNMSGISVSTHRIAMYVY